jgi:hypothetical protein
MGVPVTLTPDGRATSLIVERPSGEVWEQPVADPVGPVRFADTFQPGIYKVSLRDGEGNTMPAGRFAVNFLDTEESRIQPVAKIQVGQGEVPSDATALEDRRELWPWFLAAGLIMLVIEWWIAHPGKAGRKFLARGTYK